MQVEGFYVSSFTLVSVSLDGSGVLLYSNVTSISNMMFSCCTLNPFEEEVLEHFVDMEEEVGLFSDVTKLASMFLCCVRTQSFSYMKGTHDQVVKQGLKSNKLAHNALMDIYLGSKRQNYMEDIQLYGYSYIELNNFWFKLLLDMQ